MILLWNTLRDIWLYIYKTHWLYIYSICKNECYKNRKWFIVLNVKYNIDISYTFIEVDNHIQLIFKSLWEIEKNKINFISFSIVYRELSNKIMKINYIDKIS